MIRTSRKQIVDRTGFTLIELLVVMAIIGLLAALTAGAVMRYLSTQKGNNTETTIAKVHSELKKHWQKVVDDAQKEQIPDAVASIINTTYGCNNDNVLIRVIYTKLKLKQQFPANFYEALNPAPMPGERAYYEYLKQQFGMSDVQMQTLALSLANSQPEAFESSACLLMALQRDRSRMDLSPDFVGADSIGTIQATQTANYGSAASIPSFFVDGWGNPLLFNRWPTANVEVDQANKSTTPQTAIKRDNQDPDGKLMDPSWRYDTMGNPSSGSTNYIKSIHDLFSDPSKPIPLPSNPTTMVATPLSVYLLPVIGSGGPNKKMGIDIWVASTPNPMSIQGTRVSPAFLTIFTAPVTQGNQNDANDNLYNFRLTLGGKGN